MKKEEILRRLKIEFQKSGLSDKEFEETFQRVEFEKGFGKDLEKRFPNGSWKTINGAKVFINNGKVVAGLDGFNKEIDKFFEEKKESKKDENVSGRNRNSLIRIKRGVSADWNKAIDKWIDIVPDSAVPTVIGNFASAKKAVGRNIFSETNETSKYGTTVGGGALINFTIPKEYVPENVISAAKKAGWFNERVFEVSKDYKVMDNFLDVDSVEIVGINSKNFKKSSDIQKIKNKVDDRYENKYGSKYFLNKTMEGTLVHELGHVFNNRKRVSTSSDWVDVWEKWKKDSNIGVIKNKSEAFSEAFSNYYTKNGEDLPDYVKSFIDKIVKQ